MQFKELKKNFKAQELTEHCELIIVDNNSADETSEMVFNIIAKRFNEDLEIRYFLELEPGVYACRNRAIKESKANLLAFLDDSLVLDDTWLQECYLVARQEPVRFAAGARIAPIWKTDSPEWLSLDPPFEIMQACFAVHDYDDVEKKYPFYLNPDDELAFISDDDFLMESSSDNPISSAINNFMNNFRAKVDLPLPGCSLISRDVFQSIGQFKNDYSLSAKQFKGFEDLEFFLRVKSAGILISYLPKIKLYKDIAGLSLTKKAIIEFYKNNGRNWQYVLSKYPGSSSGGFKAPNKFSLYLQLFGLFVMYIVSMVLIDPVKIFWYRAQIAKVQGRLSATV